MCAKRLECGDSVAAFLQPRPCRGPAFEEHAARCLNSNVLTLRVKARGSEYGGHDKSRALQTLRAKAYHFLHNLAFDHSTRL